MSPRILVVVALSTSTALLACNVAAAQCTERVSVNKNGVQGDGFCSWSSISADGRYVLFESNASNLVASDTNGNWDTFLHGPWLTLEADPALVAAGATFVPAAAGAFDASGNWILSATVPSGLSGNVFTFESFGFVPTGKVEVSNPFAVQFQ